MMMAFGVRLRVGILAIHFTQAMGGYICTCTCASYEKRESVFHISGTAGAIALKYGRLGAHWPCVLLKSWVVYTCTCTRVHPIFVSQERPDGVR